MGKASRFFRSLLGLKTPDPTPTPNKQPKRRWSFVRSHRDKPHHHLLRDFDSHGDGNEESSKHAIAVAAATAAVAEAAVAAASAAAEVVRMTSRVASSSAASAGGYGFRAEWAAVKIQSCFRAYLARQALRALRGLVRLQALVRGDIQRRYNAHMMRRLQVLLRAQARAIECRARISDSPNKDHLHGPQTPEKFEQVIRARNIKYDQPSMLTKNSSRSFVQGVTTQTEHERHYNILEIDTVDHRHLRGNLFQPNPTSHSNSQSGSTIPPPGPSPTTSCEVNSKTADKDVSFCTAHNSSLEPGPFTTTPAKSESSRSGYSDHHPNYMAYTESSRAKVRSLSAPKQRPPIEFPTKRHLVYGPGPGTLRDFASKAYPGSGRLDRLGMPVGGRESEAIGFYWN